MTSRHTIFPRGQARFLVAAHVAVHAALHLERLLDLRDLLHRGAPLAFWETHFSIENK